MYDACLEKSQARHAGEITRIESEAQNAIDGFNTNWRSALHQAEEQWLNLSAALEANS